MANTLSSLGFNNNSISYKKSCKNCGWSRENNGTGEWCDDFKGYNGCGMKLKHWKPIGQKEDRNCETCIYHDIIEKYKSRCPPLTMYQMLDGMERCGKYNIYHSWKSAKNTKCVECYNFYWKKGKEGTCRLSKFFLKTKYSNAFKITKYTPASVCKDFDNKRKTSKYNMKKEKEVVKKEMPIIYETHKERNNIIKKELKKYVDCSICENCKLFSKTRGECLISKTVVHITDNSMVYCGYFKRKKEGKNIMYSKNKTEKELVDARIRELEKRIGEKKTERQILINPLNKITERSCTWLSTFYSRIDRNFIKWIKKQFEFPEQFNILYKIHSSKHSCLNVNTLQYKGKDLIDLKTKDWNKISPILRIIKANLDEYQVFLKKRELCRLTDCYKTLTNGKKVRRKVALITCEKCGIENLIEAKFCCHCGEKIL